MSGPLRVRNRSDGATGLTYPLGRRGGGAGVRVLLVCVFERFSGRFGLDVAGEVRPDVETRGAVGTGSRGRDAVRGGPSRTSSIHGAYSSSTASASSSFPAPPASVPSSSFVAPSAPAPAPAFSLSLSLSITNSLGAVMNTASASAMGTVRPRRSQPATNSAGLSLPSSENLANALMTTSLGFSCLCRLPRAAALRAPDTCCATYSGDPSFLGRGGGRRGGGGSGGGGPSVMPARRLM